MTTTETRRWLLVAVAIVGLALAATAVGAHETGTTTDHADDGATADHPHNWTHEEWGDRMENHMTEHAGPGSVAWTEEHAGVAVEGTAPHVGDGTHIGHGTGHWNHDHADEHGVHHSDSDGDHGVDADDTHHGSHGMGGRGHGC